MPRLWRFPSKASWMGASPPKSRDSSVDAAPQQSHKALQSHPMERSTSIHGSESINDTTPSPITYHSTYRPESPVQCTYSSPHLGHCDPKDLHNPRRGTDPVLLRVAEMLCEILPFRYEFSPSIFYGVSERQIPYHLRRERNNWTAEELSILAVHQIVQQAGLPIDTYIIAALILQKLDSRFYQEWTRPFPHELAEDDDLEQWVERSRELIIATALIIAQKFIHDEVYLIETWIDLVLWDRPNVTESDIKVTERLILSKQFGIDWSLREIITEKAVAELVKAAEDGADEALERLAPFLTDVNQYHCDSREYDYEDECEDVTCPDSSDYHGEYRDNRNFGNYHYEERAPVDCYQRNRDDSFDYCSDDNVSLDDMLSDEDA